MNSSAGTRILHLHVPKTAGTALRLALGKSAETPLRVFPHYGERDYKGFEPEDYDVYSGHYGFKMAQSIGGRVVTVLRNPVDRYISVYYFFRKLFTNNVEVSRKTGLAHRYSLDTFVTIKDDVLLLEELQNRITFQVAHGSTLGQRRELRESGMDEDAIFRMAADNLSTFAVVGLQEDMATFQQNLALRLGIDLTIKKINVTKNRPKVSDVSIATRRRIYDWVYMDLELYEHAVRVARD